MKADLQLVGERLESERKRLEKKAVDVYDELEIHQNTYRNYETGKRDMPSSILFQLWNMGFDVMYILTGTYTEKDSEMYHKRMGANRLVIIPELIDPQAPSDKLLLAMYDVEETLIQAGAVAGKDYSYVDLAKVAVQMVD